MRFSSPFCGYSPTHRDSRCGVPYDAGKDVTGTREALSGRRLSTTCTEKNKYNCLRQDCRYVAADDFSLTAFRWCCKDPLYDYSRYLQKALSNTADLLRMQLFMEDEHPGN